MKLRDKIAIEAMKVFMSKIPVVEVEGRDGCGSISDENLTAMRIGISVSAYEQADAMMDAR